MNRKTFIQSHGATCKNWTWSWSFVNHKEKLVIFGSWDDLTEFDRATILDEDWEFRKGFKSRSYPQSLEHIRLIQEEGYSLKTFIMEFSDEKGDGPAVIKSFIPELHHKRLLKIGKTWYAFDTNFSLPEEVDNASTVTEGACIQITVNSYERNPDARRRCIEYHKPKCSVCEFDFEKTYGPIGKGYIHVHHLIPLAKIKKEYKLDPIKDLRPICPNCHAMLHRNREELLNIDELKLLLKKNELVI